MNDDRQFATKNIAKPINAKGEVVSIKIGADIENNGKMVYPLVKRNSRRYLRPLLILLLFIEWLADTIGKIWTVIHTALIDISLSLENYINEPDNKET